MDGPSRRHVDGLDVPVLLGHRTQNTLQRFFQRQERCPRGACDGEHHERVVLHVYDVHELQACLRNVLRQRPGALQEAPMLPLVFRHRGARCDRVHVEQLHRASTRSSAERIAASHGPLHDDNAENICQQHRPRQLVRQGVLARESDRDGRAVLIRVEVAKGGHDILPQEALGELEADKRPENCISGREKRKRRTQACFRRHVEEQLAHLGNNKQRQECHMRLPVKACATRQRAEAPHRNQHATCNVTQEQGRNE
mmetsp:Transcript_5281/g.15228  ORF Transcript_5281/g.15228 Transcript_5281/m.15228 type:complete len:255 (-) Transcript_5281:368-1132(-)